MGCYRVRLVFCAPRALLELILTELGSAGGSLTIK
jgi:hypothetical protein